MTDVEAATASADPRWETVLKLRKYDEAAKDASMSTPALHTILRPLLESQLDQSGTVDKTPRPYLLSREQLRRWEQSGIFPAILQYTINKNDKKKQKQKQKRLFSCPAWMPFSRFPSSETSVRAPHGRLVAFARRRAGSLPSSGHVGAP